MRLYEITAPDGRSLRQFHDTTPDALRPRLTKGYELIGEVFGAAKDGSGGVVRPFDGPSPLPAILDAHAEELIAWLQAQIDKGRLKLPATIEAPDAEHLAKLADRPRRQRR